MHQAALVTKIQKAEDDLVKVDSSSAKKEKTKLVAFQPVAPVRLPIILNCRGKSMHLISLM